MKKHVFLLFLGSLFYAQVHWPSLSFPPTYSTLQCFLSQKQSQRNKIRFGRSGCGPVLVSPLIDTHTYINKWKSYFKQLAPKVYMFTVKIQMCF